MLVVSIVLCGFRRKVLKILLLFEFRYPECEWVRHVVESEVAAVQGIQVGVSIKCGEEPGGRLIEADRVQSKNGYLVVIGAVIGGCCC